MARRSPTESSESYAETSPGPHYEIVEEASHNNCWQNAAVSLKHCDIVFMQLVLEGANPTTRTESAFVAATALWRKLFMLRVHDCRRLRPATRDRCQAPHSYDHSCKIYTHTQCQQKCSMTRAQSLSERCKILPSIAISSHMRLSRPWRHVLENSVSL